MFNPPNEKKLEFEHKRAESARVQAELEETLRHRRSREVRECYREYSPRQIREAGAMIHGSVQS